MKTTILLTAGLMILAATSFSQIQKDNILVGGDIANFDLGIGKGSAFSMQIDPKIAYFIKDNLAVGGYLNFGLQTLPGSTGSIASYGVGALSR